MDYVTIRYVSKVPKLKNPILIEGLPGIGNVGKLAIEHLIDSVGATKFAELIVRRCAELCYERKLTPSAFTGDELLEHFGIEK